MVHPDPPGQRHDLGVRGADLLDAVPGDQFLGLGREGLGLGRKIGGLGLGEQRTHPIEYAGVGASVLDGRRRARRWDEDLDVGEPAQLEQEADAGVEQPDPVGPGGCRSGEFLGLFLPSRVDVRESREIGLESDGDQLGLQRFTPPGDHPMQLDRLPPTSHQPLDTVPHRCVERRVGLGGRSHGQTVQTVLKAGRPVENPAHGLRDRQVSALAPVAL
jgi:hypothetical protein